MCGIAGVIRWGNKPIDEEQVGFLLVGNEHRGNDASGLVIQQANGSLDVLKKDCPGWKLVQSKEYEKFMHEHLKVDSTAVLIHARGASRGNPRDNNNNHPMFAGKGAIIHNGAIKNDDILFGQFKLDRKAATDSDIFRAIIDKWGLTEEAVEKMGAGVGSGAIACVHPDFPGRVLLVRSGNPLTVASNEDFFFFSSEKNTLHRACRPYVQRRGIWFQAQRPNVDFSNMADNTAWLIGPKGLAFHKECRICTGNYNEPWRRTYEEYEARQKRFDEFSRSNSIVSKPLSENKMKVGICVKCHKEWVLPADALYSEYRCNKKKGGCDGRLAAPIVVAAKMVN